MNRKPYITKRMREYRQTFQGTTRPFAQGQKLSQRQSELLRMMAFGLADWEIADALKIRPKTVEYHRAQLFSTFHFDSFAQLVKMAVAFNLTPL